MNFSRLISDWLDWSILNWPRRACVTGQERATVRSDRSLLTCMRPGHERDGSLLTHACRAVNSGALLTGPIACMPCGGLWRGPDRPREDRIVAARGQERAKSGSPSPTEQLGARGRDREREREARRQSSQERAVGRETIAVCQSNIEIILFCRTRGFSTPSTTSMSSSASTLARTRRIFHCGNAMKGSL